MALGDGKTTQETLKSLPVLLRKVRAWEQDKGEELATLLTQTSQVLNHADELWRAFDASNAQMPQGAVALVKQTESTLKQLERVSSRADRLLKELDKKSSTAGQLWNDPKFAEDLKELVKVLRHNPKSLLFI